MSLRDAAALVCSSMMDEANAQEDSMEFALIARAAVQLFRGAAQEDLTQCSNADDWQEIAKDIENSNYAIDKIDLMIGDLLDAEASFNEDAS